MREEPLGAVVVGTGFGVLTHVRALRAAGIDVRALVGRDPEKTADRAARAGVPNALTALDDALALPDAQIVTVATPPHTHADLVLRAIAAGKHVVCEKPFARNGDEASEMLAAAESAGIIHLLGTEFRWSTGQALLGRAIREGVIGQPRLATFIMNVPVLADPEGEVPAWWSRAEEGGGWLGAYCSHSIDQVRVTLGEFTGVSASLCLVSDRNWTAEDTYTVHFRTARGVDGVLQSTAGGWGPGVICARVYGSKGSAWIEGDGVRVAGAEGTRMLDVPADLVNPPPEGPAAGLMKTAYDHLHAAGFDLAPYTRLFGVLRDRIRGIDPPADPPAATFADGLAGQRVLDAIRRSNTERAWVPIEPI
jgi:predicted dehydrogenase